MDGGGGGISSGFRFFFLGGREGRSAAQSHSHTSCSLEEERKGFL